ncbi:hypothetical protein [Vreelandella arctica]|uniref:hypothetical protein n=1 Tax=Vreelandella arctica TaxID=3126499 RepID=UPI00300DEA7D
MSKNLEINSYQRASEVLNLVGADEPIAVNVDNFVSLIGDYHLTDSEPPLQCCCEKKLKKLCGQNHRNGYVVELKGNAKSLLGSTCVNDFDPEGELKKSVSHYDNKKRYLERVSYINHCFYDKQKILNVLSKENDRLGEVNEFVSSLMRSLPSRVLSTLQGMAKTERIAVTVDVRKVVEGKNKETGEIERDVDVFTHTVGHAHGVSLFSHDYRLKLISSLKRKIDLLNELEYFKHDTGPRVVSRIHKELLEIEVICDQARAFCSEQVVFENSDRKYFIYLTSDQKERINLYRMWYLGKFSEPISISKAEREISLSDSEIIKKFGATNLIIDA